jgi:hypothetical protein
MLDELVPPVTRGVPPSTLEAIERARRLRVEAAAVRAMLQPVLDQLAAERAHRRLQRQPPAPADPKD